MKLGAKPRMLQLSDGGFDIYAVVIARETLAKEHPEWLRAFARGAYAGWKEFYRNPEPTFARLQKENPNLEPAGIRYGYGILKEKHFLEGDPAKGEFLGKADVKRWETMAAELLEIGLLKKKPVAGDAFTDAYEPAKVGVSQELDSK
jgi:NitT/TauT family transport system substrate-binding protein